MAVGVPGAEAVAVLVAVGLLLRVAVAQRLGEGVAEGVRGVVGVAPAAGEGVAAAVRVRVLQAETLALRQAEGEGLGV